VIVWALAAAAAVMGLWIIVTFNGLVSSRNDVRNSWHQIDVQLKRRHDLIHNLVSVVKGYMGYERGTLELVTAARGKAVSAAGIRDKARAEDVLTVALKRLFAVMENYPLLKSNENVMELQEELTSTENKIAFSRQLYNDLVANFNTKREIFPNSIIASLFAFGEAEYFRIEEGERR
jgi:LemA protein